MAVTTTELTDGGYVESWVDDSGTSDPDTLHVQKHSADGSLVGPEYIHSTLDGATVVALNNGGYVVATTQFVPGGQALLGEVFGPGGGHLSEFSAGRDWTITPAASGGFLVSSTFVTNRAFTRPDGLFTLYDNDGHALTAMAHVYSTSGAPTVSTDADGVFHLTWSEGTRSHDLAVDPQNPPDLTSPAAPILSYVDEVDPNTGAKAGGWTNDNTPTIRVPVSETGFVALSFGIGDPGPPRFEITADDVARGYKDIALSSNALSDGRVTFDARIEDADGLISSTGEMTIVIDTEAPGQATVSHVIDDQSGQPHDVANGGTTGDFTPTLQIAVGAGTHAGDVMTVWDNGVQLEAISISQASIDQGYVESTLNMEAGSHSITAQVSDSASNAGATSDAFTFTVQSPSDTDHGTGSPSVGDVGLISALVYEKNLPNGTAPDASQLQKSGVFTITSPDGYSHIDVAGHEVVKDDVFTAATFTTPFGQTLSITGFNAATGEMSYSYTLGSAVQSSQAGGPDSSDIDNMLITVTDHDGQTAHGAFHFVIYDDKPGVRFDTDTVVANSSTPATGNVLTDAAPGDAGDADDGADPLGADGGQVVRVNTTMSNGVQDASGDFVIHGAYGELRINSAGDYSYTVDPGVAAGSVDHFFYQIVDGDGSEVPGHGSGGHLDITVATAESGGAGQVVNSPGPGSTLNGTAGDDTINASQGPDVITTGAGHDVVAFRALPWNAGHITDFTVGSDHIDLSAIFQASGYTGSDPVADGRMTFQDDGAGGTKVYFDHDQPNGGDWPFLITTLDHVSASGLTWAQLSAAPPPAQPSVGFTTTSVSHDEGDSGVTHFQFTVTRTGDVSGQMSLHWSGFAGGQAGQAAANDFASGMVPVGSLTFMAGETSKVIDIGVVGDANVELDEGFSLKIDDAPVAITSAWAYGTIVNDDSGDTGGTPGQVYTADPPGATVVGGAGDDTINASQGADRLTGGAGNDDFVFRNLPWSHGHITDFVVGADKLDFSALFQAAGYTGSDPVADGRMRFQEDSLGNTTVYFDRDQPDGGDWPFQIVTLDGVRASGLTWAQLSTGGGSTDGGGDDGGGSTDGQEIRSDQYGDVLVGGAGADTLNAGQGPDVMSGNGGADQFVWNALPWRAGAVTDFTPGVDKLDLRPLFQQAGYSGTDPIGDHHLEFRDDGHGNTAVYFDRDDPNAGDWPFLITTLQGVTPGQIGPGDWLFH